MKKSHTSNSEEETFQIAKKFTKKLEKGDVIFLIGDLGTGKTTFVKGAAAALGVNSRILSPTFSLIRSHVISNSENIKNLHHADLYRVEDVDETVEEILKEFQNSKNGVLFIEWPERITFFSKVSSKKIFFEFLDENKRKITIES